MEEMQNDIEQPKKKSTGKTVAIILLGLLLGGSVGANYFLWDKEQKSTALASSKVDSLNSISLLKDSLYNALALEEASIASLRTEIALYQSENDSLKQVLAEKETRLVSLRAQIGGGGSSSKLRALKDSIYAIKAENNDFRNKVQTLLADNENYKAMLAEKEQKIATLNGANEKLTEKVTIAAQPMLGPVNVTPLYEKKGVFIPQYKAKKVEKLQITFNVLGNPLTQGESEKTYTVRIKDPDGIVLSNSNGKLMDSNDVYTAKETVKFNGTKQDIKLNFTQKPSYKKGKYKVELKDGDEVKHTFAFELL